MAIISLVSNLLQGWIECVGCADRSAYDLTQHSEATGLKLVAEKRLPSPKTVNTVEAVPNKPILGKAFKKEAKIITDKLSALSLDEVSKLADSLDKEG